MAGMEDLDVEDEVLVAELTVLVVEGYGDARVWKMRRERYARVALMCILRLFGKGVNCS